MAIFDGFGHEGTGLCICKVQLGLPQHPAPSLTTALKWVGPRGKKKKKNKNRKQGF